MQVTLSTYLTIVSTLSINPIFLCSSQKSPIRGPAVNPTSQDLETSEMSNPPSPVVSSPSLTQSNHDMLTSIRSHLDDQEVKIQEQLFRFQGIKRYVDRGRGEETYDALAGCKLIDGISVLITYIITGPLTAFARMTRPTWTPPILSRHRPRSKIARSWKGKERLYVHMGRGTYNRSPTSPPCLTPIPPPPSFPTSIGC